MSAKCKSCGAPIVWARSEKGTPMPIDAQKSLFGNIELSWFGRGEPPTATIVAPGSGSYVSHFATCPKASAHRRRKAATHEERGS